MLIAICPAPNGIMPVAMWGTISRPEMEVRDVLHSPIMLQRMSPYWPFGGRADRPPSCPLLEAQLPRQRYDRRGDF
jgi:hypothetical protein